MSSLESILERARSEHECNPGASARQLAAAEERLGYALPEELKGVLLAANGIRFWPNGDYPCHLLPAVRLGSVRSLMGTSEGPPGIIAFLEMEADFVGVDLNPDSESYLRVIDCYHDTFPYELCGIGDSIQQVLKLILDSDGKEWAWPAVLAYSRDFAE